jgi:iron complex transport system substrate-binding protein
MSATRRPSPGPSRRRGAVLTGALSLALLATACGGGEPAPSGGSAPATPATRSVTTDRGPVTVPGDPQRIVSLSGGLTGYLYALDAEVAATDTRVLGVTDLDGGFPPAWANDAREQGTIALPGGDQLNLEAVAAARPDLIIGGGQGITAVQAADNYDELTAMAPTVLVPTSAAGWQDQLRIVADATGRSAEVAGLVTAYDDKLAQVKSAITVPDGPAAFLLSLPNNKPYLVPPTAALPKLMTALGFTADDTLGKAGNPQLFGSGDSFEVSPELLAQVATAPTIFVIPTGGRPASELAEDPLYAQLPAFRSGQVHELPATSYRPDYDGVLSTLDLVGKEFRR